jgi:hypothetical protein
MVVLMAAGVLMVVPRMVLPVTGFSRGSRARESVNRSASLRTGSSARNVYSGSRFSNV